MIVGKKIENAFAFSENDILRLSEIIFLLSIWFIEKEIILYYKTEESGRVQLLKKLRQDLLDDIHRKEKNIAKIDCLICCLKNKK